MASLKSNTPPECFMSRSLQPLHAPGYVSPTHVVWFSLFFYFYKSISALFYYSLVGRDCLSAMLPHCCFSIIFCSWFTGYVLCFQLQCFLSTFLSTHGKPQKIIFIKVINQLNNFLSVIYLTRSCAVENHVTARTYVAAFSEHFYFLNINTDSQHRYCVHRKGDMEIQLWEL